MNESKTKQNATPRSLPAKTRAEVEANNAEWQKRLSGSAEVLREGNQNDIVSNGDIGEVGLTPPPAKRVPNKDKRQRLKSGIDKLTEKEVSAFEALICGTDLAPAFGLINEKPKAKPKSAWKESNSPLSPADYIREKYGAQKPDGSWDFGDTTTATIKDEDIALYNAYYSQVRRNENKEIAEIPFPRRGPASPEKVHEQQKAAQRAHYHRNKPK